ncbi:MAG: hypothetical protein KC417_08965, partial [Myxococcales bacterium]|nr:hypothetical protein [Myxococcales bacterium]
YTGATCGTDVNECVDLNNPCNDSGDASATCQNTGGGYSCTCSSGAYNAASNCAPYQYTIGFSVSGLANGRSVELTLSGSASSVLEVSADGSHTFDGVTLPGGGTYSVAVTATPTGQACAVTNGSGTVSGNVTNITVACGYAVGGTISGLDGATVELRNNQGDALSLSSDGSFTFSKGVADAGVYVVQVAAAPADVACLVTNRSGTIASAPVSNVAVSCFSAKKVFLSAGGYNGNLAAAGGQAGGLAAADALCQARADARGIGGTYKAWLSDSVASPSTRFTHATIPYVLIDGSRQLATNYADIIDGVAGATTVYPTINVTETLATVTSSAEVWTNTNGNGTAYSTSAASTCSDWTMSSGGGRTGLVIGSGSDSRWSTWYYDRSCSTSGYRLYCFEQ